MYQKKDGDGALFQNRKQKDSHPDVRGDFLLDGKEYEIAGWQKSTRNGDPWWSLKVQPKRQKPAGAQRQEPSRQPQNDPLDPDIPW